MRGRGPMSARSDARRSPCHLRDARLAYGVWYAYRCSRGPRRGTALESRTLAGAFAVFALVHGTVESSARLAGLPRGPASRPHDGGVSSPSLDRRWSRSPSAAPLSRLGILTSLGVPHRPGAVRRAHSRLVLPTIRSRARCRIGGNRRGIFAVVPLSVMLMIDALGWRWLFACWASSSRCGPFRPLIFVHDPPDSQGRTDRRVSDAHRRPHKPTPGAALAYAPFAARHAQFCGNLRLPDGPVHQVAFLVDHGIRSWSPRRRRTRRSRQRVRQGGGGWAADAVVAGDLHDRNGGRAAQHGSAASIALAPALHDRVRLRRADGHRLRGHGPDHADRHQRLFAGRASDRSSRPPSRERGGARPAPAGGLRLDTTELLTGAFVARPPQSRRCWDIGRRVDGPARYVLHRKPSEPRALDRLNKRRSMCVTERRRIHDHVARPYAADGRVASSPESPGQAQRDHPDRANCALVERSMRPIATPAQAWCSARGGPRGFSAGYDISPSPDVPLAGADALPCTPSLADDVTPSDAVEHEEAGDRLRPGPLSRRGCELAMLCDSRSPPRRALRRAGDPFPTSARAGHAVRIGLKRAASFSTSAIRSTRPPRSRKDGEPRGAAGRARGGDHEARRRMALMSPERSAPPSSRSIAARRPRFRNAIQAGSMCWPRSTRAPESRHEFDEIREMKGSSGAALARGPVRE